MPFYLSLALTAPSLFPIRRAFFQLLPFSYWLRSTLLWGTCFWKTLFRIHLLWFYLFQWPRRECFWYTPWTFWVCGLLNMILFPRSVFCNMSIILSIGLSSLLILGSVYLSMVGDCSCLGNAMDSFSSEAWTVLLASMLDSFNLLIFKLWILTAFLYLSTISFIFKFK